MASLPDLKKLKHWWAIEKELQTAMVVLMCDSPNRQLEAQYDEFLNHNELELAYRTLQQLAQAKKQLPDFHQCIQNAAKLMNLKD